MALILPSKYLGSQVIGPYWGGGWSENVSIHDRIDLEHPLAQGLEHAFFFIDGAFVDLVTGTQMLPVGSPGIEESARLGLASSGLTTTVYWDHPGSGGSLPQSIYDMCNRPFTFVMGVPKVDLSQQQAVGVSISDCMVCSPEIWFYQTIGITLYARIDYASGLSPNADGMVMAVSASPTQFISARDGETRVDNNSQTPLGAGSNHKFTIGSTLREGSWAGGGTKSISFVYLYRRRHFEPHELSLLTEVPRIIFKPPPYVLSGLMAIAGGGGPTLKTASESLLPMSAESAALLALLARSEGLAPLTAEAKGLLGLLGRSDDLAPLSGEAGALAAAFAGADTLAPLTAEAKALQALLGRSDTLSPLTAEAAALAAILAAADTLLPKTAEAAALLALLGRSEDLAPSLAEAAALLADRVLADALAALTAESAALVPLGDLDTVAAADTLLAATAEAAGIAATLAAAETLLAAADALAAIAAVLGAADTAPIGWAEAAAVVAALATADTVAPLTAEAALLTHARAAADALGVTLAELAALLASESAGPVRVLGAALAARARRAAAGNRPPATQPGRRPPNLQ